MDRLLISIIIPTYNSGKTIAVCLNSIAAQSFKNYEVIIADGLSKDNTVEIANTYRNNIPLLHIISEADKGIYDAMNKGIKTAKGSWLYFLGSDDFFYDKFVLENIYTEITNESKLDVIYGNIYSSKSNGFYDGEFNYEKIFRQNICHQAIFFNKNVFKRTGKFNLTYKSLADWDNNLKWFLSPTIKKKYTALTIAEYSDGGYSSQYMDLIFRSHLPLKFIKYGANVLERSLKFSIWKNEMRKALKTRYKKRVLLLLCYLYYVII